MIPRTEAVDLTLVGTNLKGRVAPNFELPDLSGRRKADAHGP